jgi:xanthine dehydrogenase accessory factor
MKDLVSEITRWRGHGARVAVATVVDAKKSAPRAPGAKMAVSSDGQITGSVSGGCVEGAVVEIAEAVLAGEDPRLVHFGIADAEAWGVGLPCGGEIAVWVEVYEPGPVEEIIRAGGRAAEVTVIEGEGLGAKLLVRADGARSGSLGSSERDERAAQGAAELMWGETSARREELFIDVIAPPPRLILFGAVDVASWLCALARVSGWRTYVVDPRARYATRERFPDAEDVIAAWPEEAFAQLGGIDPATSIVALTHDPKLDDAALTIALRSPARFVGAMGSRRAQADRRERLLAAGLEEGDLERLSAPVGLDLGAISTRETALSILAEVVAARHRRAGGRLAEGRGRIHEVPA